ncbi:MAG: hypothetical protein NTZ10_00990 [Candidatus Saganbacteria bacterium]|nr:hypothetical protein [Candidatus Saganbacteria bacterium]
MNKWFSLFCLIVISLVVILSGCAQSPVASITSTTGGREYYPNTQGYSWTYTNTSGSTTSDWTESFTGVTTYNGMTMQVLHSNSGAGSSDALIVVTDNNAKQYGTLASPTTEAITGLVFPLSIRSSWVDSVTSPVYTDTVISIEDVTVPAGTFTNCFKIKSGSIHSSGYGFYKWLAKDVGFVKWVSVAPGQTDGSSYTDVLKSKNF